MQFYLLIRLLDVYQKTISFADVILLSTGLQISATRNIPPMKCAPKVSPWAEFNSSTYLVDDCQLIVDSGRPQLCLHQHPHCSVSRTNTRLGDARVREFGTVYPPHCSRL